MVVTKVATNNLISTLPTKQQKQKLCKPKFTTTGHEYFKRKVRFLKKKATAWTAARLRFLTQKTPTSCRILCYSHILIKIRHSLNTQQDKAYTAT